MKNYTFGYENTKRVLSDSETQTTVAFYGTEMALLCHFHCILLIFTKKCLPLRLKIVNI